MFRIQKKIKYALIALRYMSSKQKDELVTAKEICASCDIPFDPTSKVLQIMTQKGVLKAEQGAAGGYCLTRALSSMTFFDLSRMIAGSLSVADCCDVPAVCERMTVCGLKKPMDRLNDRLRKVFKDIKVSEMISNDE